MPPSSQLSNHVTVLTSKNDKAKNEQRQSAPGPNVKAQWPLIATVVVSLCVIVSIISPITVFSRQYFRGYEDSAIAPRLVLSNFPDPGLVHFNGSWYAFGTNPLKRDPTVKPHVPVAVSKDFQNWMLSSEDALPVVGGWETTRDHWAPDVIQRVSIF